MVHLSTVSLVLAFLLISNGVDAAGPVKKKTAIDYCKDPRKQLKVPLPVGHNLP
jgi:hypothetical protein